MSTTPLRALAVIAASAGVAYLLPQGAETRPPATPLDLASDTRASLTTSSVLDARMLALLGAVAGVAGVSRTAGAAGTSGFGRRVSAVGDAGSGGGAGRDQAARPEQKGRGLVAAGVVGALTLALRRVDVTVEHGGVTIRSGFPGIGGTIPMAHVRSARAVTVTAGEFLGYGLRISPRRGLGLILRSGPALTMNTRWGPLTITVDQPEDAARLINHYVGR